MKSYDLIIVGSGLSGTTAALCARQKGLRVALCSRGFGRTALSSGALHLALAAARQSEDKLTISEHLSDVVQHNPFHPFAVMGAENCKKNILAAFSVLQNEGADLTPLNLEQPHKLAPAADGRVYSVCASGAAHLVPPALWPSAARVGVVQIAPLADMNAQRLAQGFAHDARLMGHDKIQFSPIVVNGAYAESAVVAAQELDDVFRLNEFIADLSKKIDGHDALFLPPIAGLNRHSQVFSHLQKALKVPIYEMLAARNSVPGLRLQAGLEQAAKKAGVDRYGEVLEVVHANHRVEKVVLKNGDNLSAHSFLLCTGGLAVGGLRFDPKPEHSLLQLPLLGDQGFLSAFKPQDLYAAELNGDHTLLSAGVAIDGETRVRSSAGTFSNLYAAGSIVGGRASRHCLSVDGIALACAYTAINSIVGRSAAGHPL